MLRHLLLALFLTACAHAESFEDVQKQTDMTNADSVFQLAKWCAENRMPSRAQQLYRQVLKIDKDHYGANNALGNVQVGDRWVHRSLVKQPAGGQAQPGADGQPAPVRSSAGPGPTAKEVAWDLSIEKDAGPAENPFLDRYIEQMRKVANDSNEMGASVATLMREDNWASAFPRLCKALLQPGYGDIYGPSEMLLELHKQGRTREVRRLYPFVVKASEGVTDAEDLEYFAMLSITIRDRKAVPRLAELLGHSSTAVQDAAREALAAITRLPAKDLTAARAKAWWDANWSLSEDQVLAEQLRSADPSTAVAAAAGLCEMRNKDIFPVLFKLLRSDDPGIVRQAVDVLRRATALDWGITPALSAAERGKQVDRLEKWWAESKFSFAWPGLPSEDGGAAAGGVASGQPDPDAEEVEKLASAAGTDAQTAEQRLRTRGTAAIRALLAGLESPSPLIRRRAHDILCDVTKKNFGYDPRGEEPARLTAISAWRAWAEKEKLLGPPPAGEPKAE